jgi:metal-sulfur cluster biosynthetic enzyme
MPSADDVRRALADVRDPCSLMNRTNLDIVEMGLVEDVGIDGGGVTVTLLLTDPTCIFFFEIARQIKERLSGLPGVESVEVVSLSDRLWEPDRIAPAARERLRIARERRARQLGVRPRGAPATTDAPH